MIHGKAKPRTNVLIGLVMTAVLLSIVFTFWRAIVQKDFYIVMPEEATEEPE